MDSLNYYWQGAAYQDYLLQTYRNFHLTTQSIFIAIGAGLAYGILDASVPENVHYVYGLLVTISALGIYLLIRMRRLIIARGQDVDFFHNRIIYFEKDLQKQEQVLTEFKVYQKFHRQQTHLDTFFKNFELSEKTRLELTDKGKGHTRRFLDNHLFFGFIIVWLCFHAVCIKVLFF